MKPDLLEVLVCTWCLGPLRLEGERLRCGRCRAEYRVEHGIPNMVIEDATLFCPVCGEVLERRGAEAACPACRRRFDTSRRLEPDALPPAGGGSSAESTE